MTHHLRTPDLHNISIARPQGRLATDHVRAVTQHRDADERVAVSVPANDGLVVFPGAASDALVFSIRLPLTLDSRPFLGCLLLGLYGDVDVADLEVHVWNEVNAGNLGYG